MRGRSIGSRNVSRSEYGKIKAGLVWARPASVAKQCGRSPNTVRTIDKSKDFAHYKVLLKEKSKENNNPGLATKSIADRLREIADELEKAE